MVSGYGAIKVAAKVGSEKKCLQKRIVISKELLYYRNSIKIDTVVLIFSVIIQFLECN